MGTQRILMIGAAGTLHRALSRRGHHVRFASNAAAALPSVLRGDWDACIVSCVRNQRGSEQLVQCLEHQAPETAVIVSAMSTRSAEEIAHQVGADGWVGEYDAQGVAGRVAAAIARRRWSRRAPPRGRPGTSLLNDALAHEINNPATYVMANLATLRERVRTLCRELDDRVDLSLQLAEMESMLEDSLEGMARIRQITRRPCQLDEAREVRSGERARVAPASDVMPKATRPLRLLLVDDEALVLRSLRRMLREHCVETAQGGERALARLEHDRNFDLVLCDLVMPGIDGPAVHETLRRIAPELLPRLVFFSGGAYSARARHFVDAVSPPLMSKPLTREAIVELLSTATGRRREAAGR